MSTYSTISIIFNPRSTGSSQALAKELKEQLKTKRIFPDAVLMPTKYAGHAEALAYQLATASDRPLIISASGDGGYNEVINGLMRAQAEGFKPVAGLLPGGNANDHFHNVHQHSLPQAIKTTKTRKIDLLKLDSISDKRSFSRYAHSYIGFGLTPRVGHQLNQVDLNRLKEGWIVAKELVKLKPIEVIINNKKKPHYSLLFNNVGKMSKILSLSEVSEPDDGKFEVIIFQSRTKLQLLATLLKATTTGLNVSRQAARFEFTTTARILVQLDGEIAQLDANAPIAIELERAALECVV